MSIKSGDVMVYVGATDTQVSFGRGVDPRPILVVGQCYTVEYVFVHSWHTTITLLGVIGNFNSVCFEATEGKEAKPVVKRNHWSEYYMEIVKTVATRSTCLRRKVGAIAVKDKRILATGYNGSPSGTSHCEDVGCIRQQRNIASGTMHELCRAIHAEQNIIVQAASHGISLVGSDIYCTTQPCIICAKLLIGCKVKNIYYIEKYNDQLSEDLFKEAGINLIQYTAPKAI